VGTFMPAVNNQQLLATVDNFIQTAKSKCSALEGVVGLLSSNYKHFAWTGIYILDDGMLKLGPYRGNPSSNVEIPVGKGICGAAVKEDKTIIVPDVKADPRFLVYSIATKSEIVVPIRKDGVIVGEIDIDSDDSDAFTEDDRKVLELVADKLSKLF